MRCHHQHVFFSTHLIAEKLIGSYHPYKGRSDGKESIGIETLTSPYLHSFPRVFPFFSGGVFCLWPSLPNYILSVFNWLPHSCRSLGWLKILTQAAGKTSPCRWIHPHLEKGSLSSLARKSPYVSKVQIEEILWFAQVHSKIDWLHSCMWCKYRYSWAMPTTWPDHLIRTNHSDYSWSLVMISKLFSRPTCCSQESIWIHIYSFDGNMLLDTAFWCATASTKVGKVGDTILPLALLVAGSW